VMQFVLVPCLSIVMCNNTYGCRKLSFFVSIYIIL